MAMNTILLLATAFVYTYTGDSFTSSTSPDTPGLRLSDRITTSFTIDDSLWGTHLNTPDLAPLASGPILGSYSTQFTTDLHGQILSWGISGDGPGFDSGSYGLEDGSGRDFMAGERFSQGERYDVALIDYAPGSPSRWSFAPVPDGGSSALMLSFASAVLFFFRPRFV